MRVQTARIVMGLVTVLALCGGCGTSPDTVAISKGATAAPGGTKPVEVSLVLSRTTLRSGEPLPATILITNTTGHLMKIPCDTAYLVGLSSRAIPFDPAIATVLCNGKRYLSPGATRVIVTISTDYQGCGTYGPSTESSPRCLMKSGTPWPQIPPLPSGQYRTSVIVLGIPNSALAFPAPVTVTLRR